MGSHIGLWSVRSGSWSLKTLADHLSTLHRKLETDEHGAELTPEYLKYAVNDVQVTWECFEKLNERYEEYHLTQTPVSRIYSEAGIGKAYLKEMGIKPWRELQPDFPPQYLGMLFCAPHWAASTIG